MRIDELSPELAEAVAYDSAYSRPSLAQRESEADLDRFLRLMEDPNA